jgi:hypothetical protein
MIWVEEETAREERELHEIQISEFMFNKFHFICKKIRNSTGLEDGIGLLHSNLLG